MHLLSFENVEVKLVKSLAASFIVDVAGHQQLEQDVPSTVTTFKRTKGNA